MQQHLPVHLAGLYASSKQTCPLPSSPPIQTMLRIRDPAASLDFYTRVLGMT
jgi:hypothetical protein